MDVELNSFCPYVHVLLCYGRRFRKFYTICDFMGRELRRDRLLGSVSKATWETLTLLNSYPKVWSNWLPWIPWLAPKNLSWMRIEPIPNKRVSQILATEVLLSH